MLGTLRRQEGGLDRFLLSLGQAHVTGVSVDWQTTGTPVGLPTYAFQHRRFWPAAEPITGPAEEPADAAFWQAVDTGDLDLDVSPGGPRRGAARPVGLAARPVGEHRDRRLAAHRRLEAAHPPGPSGDGRLAGRRPRGRR